MYNCEEPAFAGLVRAYSAELYRFAYWLSRDRFIAEDLVQETFARAWSARKSLREERAAKRWLYTILHNEHARMFVRKRLDMVDDQDLDALEDQRLTGGFEDIAMREALHGLAAGYREPLLLQVLGGFSCEEIGQLLNLTPGAVMTRLSRARLTLRRNTLNAANNRATTETRSRSGRADPFE